MATIIKKSKALNYIPSSAAGYQAARQVQNTLDGNQMIDDTPGYVQPADKTSGTSSSDSTNSQYTGSGQTPAVSSKPKFTQSARTSNYYNDLSDAEDSRPDSFTSKYTAAIDNILNTIQNPSKFNLASDDTYNQLYNQYKESYMNQGNRAMRDTTGNAAALTGGYGNTYAENAGSQAYDNYLTQLNDKNINLAQMALDSYWNDRSDKYNQLNAVQNADNTDYGRYRDTVSDWQNNRSYYANQAQNSYGNDFNRYSSNLDQYNTETAADTAAKQYAEQVALKKAEDAQAQQNWQTQWDYKIAQDAEKKAKAGSSGGSGGSGRKSSGSSSKSSGSGSYSTLDQIAAAIKQGIKDGTTTNYQAVKNLANYANAGDLTTEERDYITQKAGLNTSAAAREKAWNAMHM